MSSSSIPGDAAPAIPVKDEQHAPSYRSGVAARLAGLRVETLRVWERRYALSATPRSMGGQRLYSSVQVRHLGLLKQLVDQGHAIGLLAGLPLGKLEELRGAAVGNELDAARHLCIAVVGGNLMRRIAADRRRDHGLTVQRGCDDLAQAAACFKGMRADALLVELSELDPAALPLIVAARDAMEVTAVVIVYRFCASATIRALRAQGCLVARVPAELVELMLLCRTAMAAKAPQLAARPRPVVGPPRFNDEVLASIAAIDSALPCECPRHLADLLMMTGSFERYSIQRASRDEPSAELHRELAGAAGMARTILEAALAQLARAEGISLPEKDGFATPSTPVATVEKAAD
jgi:hypothetical protein